MKPRFQLTPEHVQIAEVEARDLAGEQATAQQFSRREAVRARDFEASYGVKYFRDDALSEERSDTDAPEFGDILDRNAPLIELVERIPTIDPALSEKDYKEARAKSFEQTATSLVVLADQQMLQTETHQRPISEKERDATTIAAQKAAAQRNPLR